MQKRGFGLYYFGLFLAGWVFFLIIAGGAVTSHQAGLAVPDWPLSYGRFFPPMVGNIFWEHGHRMIAGIAAIMTLMTAILIQIKENRLFVKKLAWAAVGTVLLQAVLGGVTVLLLLPPAVSVAHACLGQTFFCLVLALAYYLRPVQEKTAVSHPSDARLKRFVVMTTAFVYVQLILGAVIRHGAGHVHLLITHIVFALVVVSHILVSVLRVNLARRGDKNVIVSVDAWGVLALLQIFLGIGAFVFTRVVPVQNDTPGTVAVIFTVAHQSMGAAILGLGVLLSLMFSTAGASEDEVSSPDDSKISAV